MVKRAQRIEPILVRRVPESSVKLASIWKALLLVPIPRRVGLAHLEIPSRPVDIERTKPSRQHCQTPDVKDDGLPRWDPARNTVHYWHVRNEQHGDGPTRSVPTQQRVVRPPNLMSRRRHERTPPQPQCSVAWLVMHTRGLEIAIQPPCALSAERTGVQLRARGSRAANASCRWRFVWEPHTVHHVGPSNVLANVPFSCVVRARASAISAANWS